MTQFRYTEQLGTYFPVVLHVRLAMCVICCFIMWIWDLNGDGSTPMIFWGVNRVRIIYRPFWGSPRCDQCPNMYLIHIYSPKFQHCHGVHGVSCCFWKRILSDFAAAESQMFFDTLPYVIWWDNSVGYGGVSPWTWNPYWQPAKENYVLGFWRFWALFIILSQDIQYIIVYPKTCLSTWFETMQQYQNNMKLIWKSPSIWSARWFGTALECASSTRVG